MGAGLGMVSAEVWGSVQGAGRGHDALLWWRWTAWATDQLSLDGAICSASTATWRVSPPVLTVKLLKLQIMPPPHALRRLLVESPMVMLSMRVSASRLVLSRSRPARPP